MTTRAIYTEEYERLGNVSDPTGVYALTTTKPIITAPAREYFQIANPARIPTCAPYTLTLLWPTTTTTAVTFATPNPTTTPVYQPVASPTPPAAYIPVESEASMYNGSTLPRLPTMAMEVLQGYYT